MTWLMAFISIVGTVLNIKKKKLGFVLWAVTNVYWAAHNILIKEYAMGLQFVVYSGLSFWGLYEWSQTTKENFNLSKEE